jgi:dTDP-4-dehydrorhamnose reductase
MTRWLVTGAGGALGSDLVEVLNAQGENVVGLDRTTLDITDEAAVGATLDTHRPDVVINAAAYTQVDDAEHDEAAATRVNGDAPGTVARWCAANGARLIHVSTDYVFAGDATEPYAVDARPSPRSAYGRSKLAGEAAVRAAGGDAHVVRTAWVYGVHGPSFIRTIGARLLRGEPVSVVDDQVGAPTWSRQLAQRLVDLGTADVKSAVWHCTASGETSWFGVAVALAEELGVAADLVRPCATADLPRTAERPAYSVLSNDAWRRAGLEPLPDWREALREALAASGEALTS